ncbi:transposase [Puniceicoccaceae bacterium K14]|nr:transposase [Puniceicoccaceae bacterium K14]
MGTGKAPPSWAPWLLNAAMNGESFLTYVKTQLLPTLKAGDIVICDNLASHKVKGVAEAIESAGAKLAFLPPYSPDLNPIEMAFSKMKTLLRKAAARTFQALLEAVAKPLPEITKSDCSAFFRHAGYES